VSPANSKSAVQALWASPVLAASPEGPARAFRKLAVPLGLPAAPEGCMPVEEWPSMV